MWQFLFSLILNSLFPRTCCICLKEGESICHSCQKRIRRNPKWSTQQEIRFWSVYDYHDSIHRQLIQQWKYKGDQSMLQLLMEGIQLPDDFSPIDLIIPVPLHKRKQCERGYNQAAMISDVLHKIIDKPITKKLIKTNYTIAQATLSKTQRLKNVEGSFRWKGESLIGKTVLLVDDVVSTGSTIKACETILKKAAAKTVIAFSLARAENKKTID